MNKKVFLFILPLLALPITVLAQKESYDPETNVMVMVGYNGNHSTDLEASLAYYPFRLFGVSVSVNSSFQNYTDVPEYGGASSPTNGYWEMPDKKVLSFSIIPELSLRTPKWRLGGEEGNGLFLVFNPGLNIVLFPDEKIKFHTVTSSQMDGTKSQFRTITNKHAQWFYWRTKFSFSYQLDVTVISLGFYISNYDVYGGRRNIVINGNKLNNSLPEKEMTGGVFLSIGRNF